MASLEGLGKYESTLRRDLTELSANMWFGQPVTGEKAGNFRAVYLIFSANIAANTAFALQHKLSEVPVAYMVVGTPTSSIIRIDPAKAGSVLIPWSENYVYFQSPDSSTSNPPTVCIMLWGLDSGG